MRVYHRATSPRGRRFDLVAIFAIVTGFSGLMPAAGTLANQVGTATTSARMATLAKPSYTRLRLPRRTVTGGSPAYNWVTLHLGPLRDGAASNSPLSTANAGSLGVAWATNLYGAGLDSPVVYYDNALNQTLSIIGTEHGDVLAVNVTNGQIVWSTWVGSPIRATPIVAGGAVFVATFDSSRIYKISATTGAIDCSVASPMQVEGTPVAANPPGGIPTIYFGTNDNSSQPGPLVAVAQSSCKIEWTFSNYVVKAGTWDPSSYAVDAAGVPLVIFGTADPDAEVYALNAVTGAEVWHFASYNPPPGIYDVGAGLTIAPPKMNGFADGVVYVPSKYGILYALNLTTGAVIWSFNYNQALGRIGGGISTAALSGKNLVLGYDGGLIDVNAVTGTLVWQYTNPAKIETDSSPAIAGAPGSQIAVVGDLAGGIDVVSLATGAQLYRYQTGGYITASPAITDGNIIISSSDGYLYDLAVGGGNEPTTPTTGISYPADSSSISNPNGNLTVQGTASDQLGVIAVVVAIQESGPDGPWWDAATGKWVSGPIGNPAALATPNGLSTNWSFAYPVPTAGGTYQVIAYAVSSGGQSDISSSTSSFAVGPTTTSPYLTVSPSSYVPPAGTVDVSGSGFGSTEAVTISLLGTVLATTTSSASGAITNVPVKIPLDTAFGQMSLMATGQTSGAVATTAIVVANNWVQLGYQASHTGYEPNDSVLFNNISPGDGIFLDLAWLYQSGSPINAAPVVAAGVAYDGNSSGQVTALDVHNGAPLWSYSLGSGTAVDGSLAVDAVKHLVFVSGSDGSLTAISAVTGKKVWSDAIGGPLFAPVYGLGMVVVSSSNGSVEAVWESSGKQVWSAKMSSAVTVAATIDVPAKRVIVGLDDGRVVAFAAQTGATQWTFNAPSPVSAPTATIGGVAYVPAGDVLYALNESTGVQKWSYVTAGAITGSPAISGAYLYFGSQDGNVYALTVASGSLFWQLSFGHPIVGVAVCNSIVAFVSSDGYIGVGRSWASLELWKYRTGAGISAPPVIVDGTLFVGAGDGGFYAMTPYGEVPK